MKRFLLFFVFILSFLFSNAIAITWVGPAAGNWNTTSNWSSASIPGPNDDVTFNTSVVVNMNNIISAPYIINSLKITNNANVELQLTQSGGGNRFLQVKSTNTSIKGLQIDAGSTLVMHGINTLASGTLNYGLDFSGAAGVTGEISGELDFSGVGSAGTADNVRLRVYTDAANNASMIVRNGGVIKYLDLAGNTTSAAGSYLTMENGSVYEIAKNGGSFPEATWQPTSLARANNVFGANGPVFLGSAYGNMEWNCQSQTAASFLTASISFNNVNFITTNGNSFFVKTGASVGNHTMTINGNLDIDDGAFINIVGSTATAGSAGKILLKGNLNVHPGGNLTSNGATGAFNQFELNGSSNQNITVDGLFFGGKFEFIMNGVSATLLTPVTLPGNNLASGPNLQLLNGKIITTATNVLKMVRNSTYSGGSPASFVQGPMSKEGDNATFKFPVGVGSIYAPVTYSSSGMAATDVVTGEYVRANPQGMLGNTYNPAGNPEIINHISFVEYWKVQKTTGVYTSAAITLSVTQYSFCKVFNTTFVARFDNSNGWWTNSGTAGKNPGPNIPPYETGTITTPLLLSTEASLFFTLGTNDTYGVNPLPVNLIAFDAIKLNTSKSSVTWELAACCSPNAKFEIQRAGSNRNFSTIGSVRGSATSTLYAYPDNGLKAGINYYRLKIIEEDGTISYSRTAVIMNGVEGLLLTSIAPAAVTSTTTLSITSSKEQKIDLLIIDIHGRIVKQRTLQVSTGNTNTSIETTGLAAGAYHLVGILNGEKTNVLRFIKL